MVNINCDREGMVCLIATQSMSRAVPCLRFRTPILSIAAAKHAAKMSQRALIMSLEAKTHISLTTVAGQSSMDCGRIENMVIEAVLFISFSVAPGAAIVKA